jgi:alkylation response protein AidB-like acyl-CoA dehydrogenase
MGWRADTDIQQMLRESAQGHLTSAGGPAHFRTVREREGGFDPAAWKGMAALGWTGILLPESVGGSDLGMEPALTLAEELGRAVAPEPFVACAVMAATVLAAAPGESARTLAKALVTGEESVTLAWQERTGQVGLTQCETRLSGGKLSGHKLHVPAWHAAARLLVWAQGDDGDAIVAVDPAASGIACKSRRMADASFEADVAFDNVVVAPEAVILSGGDARKALTLAIARGTVALSAQMEGLAASLWQRTADYVKQRVQFDQPLADFQVLRHRLVDLYADIELSAASWRKAAGEVEGGMVDGMALHAAKARCSQTALDMGRWAIQLHGAFGFTDEADVGLYVNSALRWSSWLGNAAAHRRLALAAHRQSASTKEA